MKTDAMLRHFAHHDCVAPTTGWEKLVWMAAELVKRAQKERRTWRELRTPRKSQQACELTDNQQEFDI